MSTTKLETIQKHAVPATRVLRAVPMPPFAHRRGAIPMHPPDAAVSALFSRAVTTVEVRNPPPARAMQMAGRRLRAAFARGREEAQGSAGGRRACMAAGRAGARPGAEPQGFPRGAGGDGGRADHADERLRHDGALLRADVHGAQVSAQLAPVRIGRTALSRPV
jgi:hypothetical protein